MFKRPRRLKLEVKLKPIYKLTPKPIPKSIKQKKVTNLTNLSTKARGLDLKNKELT